MIDHIGVRVAELGRSRAFYEAALAPLGVSVIATVPAHVTGFGDVLGFGDQRPFFWISQAPQPTAPLHLAFSAASRSQVDAFHAAALAALGQDNGAPGVRAHYHPTYYGAFVIDPDGHNVEAVCHAPE
ncbi:MAG: VOC family protein [Phenylobacterium sp.]